MSNDQRSAVERAQAELNRVCRNNWKMRVSIPADPENDSDCIIHDGLTVAASLLAENARLREANAALGHVVAAARAWVDLAAIEV
ncbi:hypothetical protein DD931_13470, partial [Staphylococcus pseudintermedius]